MPEDSITIQKFKEPGETDEKEVVSEKDYNTDWYPSEEPELDEFTDIEKEVSDRVVENPDEPILTEEELESMRKSIIPEGPLDGKYKELIDNNNKEFIAKKQKEIGGIIRDYFDIRNVAITPKYVDDLLKTYYRTKNPLYLQEIVDYAIQPDLYKFFEEVYKDLKFDARSDYKDLEYLWINTETIIRDMIYKEKVQNYTSIKDSFIPSVLTLNPMLVYHESDSKDVFEDERQEYRELHGFVSRIPCK